MEFAHDSVMMPETLELMVPRDGGVYADATVGGGGHAEAILQASGPSGRLVAVDRDPDALEAARARLAVFGERVTLRLARFSELGEVLREEGVLHVDGLVADLGVSSPQLDHAERGFSLAREGPLDMRMDPTGTETVASLLQRLDERELADVLFHYGEERRSRPIARSIRNALERGELHTTVDLRKAVVRVLGPRRRGGIDPATRTFQALRIAVNEELQELDRLLASLPQILEERGVAVLISFHSLEDRRVKHAFRGDPRLQPLTKRPRRAGEAEAARNPRARSAKLRAALRRDEEEVAA